MTCSIFLGVQSPETASVNWQRSRSLLDNPRVRVKECHEIRWISYYLAVHAVYKTWASLVMYFTKHTDKKFQAMLKKLTKYRFVFTKHMMIDILPSVSQMSMILQK